MKEINYVMKWESDKENIIVCIFVLCVYEIHNFIFVHKFLFIKTQLKTPISLYVNVCEKRINLKVIHELNDIIVG